MQVTISGLLQGFVGRAETVLTIACKLTFSAGKDWGVYE